MFSGSFRRWVAASPSIGQVLVAWSVLGIAVLSLLPIGLTLARLFPATTRFEWHRSLFLTLEYVFLAGARSMACST